MTTDYYIARGQNNYTIFKDSADVFSFADGMNLRVKFSESNTDKVTITIQYPDRKLPVKSILKTDGSQLISGDIEKNGIYEINYDGTNFQITGTSWGQGESIFDEIIYVAAEDIPAFRPVRTGGYIADSNDAVNINKLFGISKEQVLTGFSGIVQVQGIIINPSWNWISNSPIFLNGKFLSLSVPLTGYVQQIGIAVNPTTININIQQPIKL